MGAISDELDQTFAEMSGYRNTPLRSRTLSHQLPSLFLCVFSVQLASSMQLLLGSTQIATSNLYRISANHTNVQLSPKQQYVKFLHFLSSALEINTWQSYLFWYLHHHNLNQL